MNHGIYRLVFNVERNAWVAVAECVRGRGKKSARKRVAAVVLGVAVSFAALDGAWAARPVAAQLPVPSASRPFVFAGSVDGGQPTTAIMNGINTMTVTTQSRLLGLNFDSFDVGSDAAFVLKQPDALSRALFRIWDSNPSQIFGKVTANGQLYLINQNGILFGGGSQVNVGGLVASALGMSDTMMNRLLTSGLPSASGDSLTFNYEGKVADFKATVIVETGATINTRDGGKVVLIAPRSVTNEGNIGVDGGGSAETILAAGGKVILTVPSDPNLRGILVETNSFTGKDDLGISTTLDGKVTNAATGSVNMGTGGVVTLAGLIVNQQGVVNATKAVNLNGATMLVSGTTETDRLTINQRGSVAEIDWYSGFNVGSGKTVEFVQATGDVAYNYVYDPDKSLVDGSTSKLDNLAAGRSLIDGVLKASGQFVLVNELGVTFGANARVSANNFVASALGMNPGIVSSGLLGQTNVRSRAFYLNRNYATFDSSDESVAAADKARALSEYRRATVNVEIGAQIESASGGYVVLAGGSVNQAGSISTPNGQTLLAAGADVYLKPGYSSAIRGFTAEVNPLLVKDANKSGIDSLVALSRGADANAVTNTGTISASFGDISMVGHQIVQAGSLYASTSATANGSINLKARDMVLIDYVIDTDTKDIADSSYFQISRDYNVDGVLAYDPKHTNSPKATEFIFGKLGGTVTFADGSRTEIFIDGSNGKTLTASQHFVTSSVAVQGKKIVVGDADIEARGGNVNLRSAAAFSENNAFAIDTMTPGVEGTAQSDVGIYVAEGAKINVSGTSAQKSVRDLFVEVELRGEQFADNTVQRNGVLRGQKAWVDIRDAVEIADLSSYFNNVALTVNELAATGGKISLVSTGNVIVKNGATLDVSGGVVNYAAGSVEESRVLAGRKSFRLNDAPVWAEYLSLTTASRDEVAYVEGKSAGTVEIRGNRLAVDGQLQANTTVGTRQREIGDPASNRNAIPLGGQLIVQDGGQHYTVANRDTASKAEKDGAFLQAQMVFVKGAANAASGLGQDSAGPDRLELSESLVDAGFSRFSITSDGRIDIPTEISLNLPAGGKFAAAGRQIYLAGEISAPAGSIELKTVDLSASVPDAPNNLDGAYSNLVVADGASLSTSGVWVNDYLDGELSTAPLALNGGKIVLNSAHDLDIRHGSSIAVDGGGQVNTKRSLKKGNAGSIALTSGSGFGEFGMGNSLFLDGTLSGMALGKGGSLSITSSQVTLGHAASSDTGQGFVATEDVLDRGGFYNFIFTGRSALTVEGGSAEVQKIFKPDPLNWSLLAVGDYFKRPTGTTIASFAGTQVLPEALRSGTTSISLTTTDIYSGRLTVAENAYVGASAKGSVTLEAAGQMTVLGTLEAAGGTITLGRAKMTSDLNAAVQNALIDAGKKQSESIYLGENSKLLAGGTTVLDAETQQALDAGVSAGQLLARQAYRGEVLAGGTVSIDSGLGYLIMRDGALIDVSGATGTLNAATATATGYTYAARALGSAGGMVSLAAHSGMFLDGNFKARGGKDALGGVFALRFSADPVKSEANPWGAGVGQTKDVIDALTGKRVLTVYQTASTEETASTDKKSGRENHEALWPAGIDTAKYLAGTAVLDAKTYNGKAKLDVALLQDFKSVNDAAFGSWYLTSQSDIVFDGKVEATVNNHLSMNAANFRAADETTNLILTAATARIGNFRDGAGATVVAGTGLADASITARDIGLVGTFSWGGFDDSTFTSTTGAIHFDSVQNTVKNRVDGRLFNGQMTASGALTFSAARLSPSTYGDFRIDLLADPSGSIDITRPVGASTDVSLSPYGRLEFSAKTINHEGTISAPLGEVVFNAPGGTVTLAAGSKTSVAADRNLLFGATGESGSSWNYLGSKVDALPSKGIVIDAAVSKVKTGAELDLSGGGEALAWEFTAGPGGKNDVLNGSTTTFAIVPGWNGVSATDAELLAGYATTGDGSLPLLKVGDAVSLGANTLGLGGSYVLLPARYAVLPGAYLVTVKGGNDKVLAASERQADGSWLVAGASTALNADGSKTAYSQSHLTLELASSEVVANRAKYTLTTASSFFYDQAGVRLAGDAARLAVIGRSSLEFDPSVVAKTVAEISASDGRKRAAQGLALDLAAPKLYVSNLGNTPDGYSVVDPSKLQGVTIASLLLGGVRTETATGTQIDTIASSVLINNDGNSEGGTALSAGEVLATASETLTVAGNSKIDSAGDATGRDIALTGDGAFLRVAEGSQVKVSRSSVNRLQGDLTVESNAAVAGESLIFDATRGNELAGMVSPGKAVSIGAGRINVVADNSAPTEGVTLKKTDLDRFANVDQMRLVSYSTLDLYGNATLGSATLKELVVSAAGIAGHGGGTSVANISAKQVVFENANPEGAQFVAGAAFGSGSLKVDAKQITLGNNATEAMRKAGTSGFKMAGFDVVELKASGDLAFAGRGVTRVESGRVDANNQTVEAKLNIIAGRVTSTSGADHVLTSSGKLSVQRHENATTPTTTAGLGSKLELGGKSVAVSGHIDLAAGDLTLAGTQGVTLDNGALVSAAGAAVKFADTTAYASGGRITLKSTEGNVQINEGAVATVSADAGGGNAGTIRLLAEKGTVDAAAKTLRGNAASGKTQGSLVVDAASVALDRLANAVVDSSGNRHLSESWDVRRRVGDLVLTEQIKAHQFQLSADAGNIKIYGSVDASGSKGGSIGLYANRVSDADGSNAVGGKVELHAGSALKANATEVVGGGDGTAGEGGSVTIGVSATKAEDELDTEINFLAKDGEVAAASIDVSTATGSKATGGRVTFRAPRQDELGKLVDGTGAEIVDNNAMAALVTTKQGADSTDYLLVGVTNPNSLANGTVISFNAYAASKVGTTVTVGSNSKVALVNADGTALATGAIKAGQGVVAIYDNGVFKISTAAETDTGSANKYSVAPAVKPLTAADFQNPGYTVTFRPKSANTAASTLEIVSADTKKTSVELKSADGSVLNAGDLKTDRLVTAVYTVVNVNGQSKGEFRLVNDVPLASAPVEGSSMAKVGLNGNVQGAASVALEAVRVTRKTGDFLLGTAEQAALLKTASEVSALKGAIFVKAADPDKRLGTVFRVGEEIRSTGNLLVGNDWSFAKTSAAGAVGALTLRAEGDLLVSGTLTDGFVANGSGTNVVPDIYRDARVGSGFDSWSFRLVAGADADQASPLGTDASATTGSLVLADNKLIRTGTGSIDIAAAKDIELGDRAAIYTAGVADTTELDGFTPAFVNNNYTAKGVYSAFLTGGGDISLKSGGSIKVEKPALESVYQGNPNEWLMRVGGNKNLQWWSRVASFQSGIAAFGGGDISLTAGGDVSNAIVAIPTIGRVPTVDGEAQPDQALITGGGDLSVQAQGSIIGGMLYAETGKVTLKADTIKPYVIVTTNSNGDLIDNNFYTSVAIGNSSVEVVGRQDVELGNVYNPLWANTNWLYNSSYTTGAKATSGLVTVTGDYNVRLGTFGERSALDVVSLAGDVGLKAQDTVYGVTDSETHRLMPAQVKVAALSGDIRGSVVQVPGLSGQLDLLAQGSINFDAPIQQLDLAEKYLPSIRNPVMGNGLLGETGFVLLSVLKSGSALEKHTASNWHLNDSEPSRLIALTGNIVDQRSTGGVDDPHLFNEAVVIDAGGDIKNMSLDIQHNHADDVSVIKAGGDIRYDYKTVTDPKSLPTPVTAPLKGIQVGGGGSVLVQAKGTIDLADTQGIVTRGNLDNPYLPEGGANILAIAGGVPNYQGLYRELASDRTELVNLIASGKSYSAAELARNAGLQAIHQKIIDGEAVSDAEVLDVFYAKLTEFGRVAQNTGDQSQYDKGRTLAAALFPEENVGKGDILLSMSQIKTEQGGNIQMLVPGGSTVVGVAAPSLSKAASDQGIFTINGGDILAYVADDFLVNQSRVFTLDGGNIMIWANRGNIDAGSGAKTVNSTPPPVLVVRNGQIVLDTANSVSGSGIGVLASRDDTPASDMDLFAPEGAIDAGDAGLRSTGNITLGARVVLNATNIQAAGGVSGAPAPVAAVAPIAAVTTPTNNENKALEDAAPSAGKRDGAGGMLTVEVLDSEPAADPATLDEEERKRKARARAAG